MIFRNIVENSTLIITGTIIPEKMEMILGILENNIKIYSKFANIVVMLNTLNDGGEKWLAAYRDTIDELIYSTRSKAVVYHLRDYINRGWQFGTIDMERTAYDFVGETLSVGAVLKADFDIYMEDMIFNIDVSDAEVMILPSIGYATVEQHKSNFDTLMELYDTIPPQSTAYLILHPMDHLYTSPDWLNMKYKEWTQHPKGNGPHHIGVACEPLLRESFERNSFRIKPMISKQSFRNLLETIDLHKIIDPSHKNIFFEEVGICHLYDDTKEIIKI